VDDDALLFDAALGDMDRGVDATLGVAGLLGVVSSCSGTGVKCLREAENDGDAFKSRDAGVVDSAGFPCRGVFASSGGVGEGVFAALGGLGTGGHLRMLSLLREKDMIAAGLPGLLSSEMEMGSTRNASISYRASGL
jgi:hypothetical protein